MDGLRLFPERLEVRAMLTGDLVPLITFGPMEFNNYEAQGTLSAAIHADFNRDGIQDIVFGSAHKRRLLSEEHASVGIAFGNGRGGFDVEIEQLIHDDVYSLAAADLNNDGHNDIVVGGIFRLTVLFSDVDERGNWNGLKQPVYLGGASERVVIEDFDSDGMLDIATASIDHWFGLIGSDFPNPVFADRDVKHVNVYRNSGNGEFTLAAKLNGIQYLFADDYDADGDVDLVARLVPDDYRSEAEDHQAVIDGLDRYLHPPRAFHIHENQSTEGQLVFVTSAPSADNPFGWDGFSADDPSPRVEHDINGDGYLDQLSSSRGYDFGNYNTQSQTVISYGGPDGNRDAPISVSGYYVGKDTGPYDFGWGRTIVSAPQVFVFDVDGNGDDDIVARGGQAILRQGLLVGFALDARNYPSTSNTLHRSFFVDFNKDGRLDMVSSALVQEGMADGSFAEAYAISLEEYEQAKVASRGIFRSGRVFEVDVDGDGVAENFSRNQGEFELDHIRDTNLDSHLDMVLHRTIDGEKFRYVRLGDGTGNFDEPQLNLQPVVTTSLTRGGVSVRVREATALVDSRFQPVVTAFQIPIPNETRDNPSAGSPHHEARMLDADGDGDLDIIVAHGAGVAVVLGVGAGDFNQDGKLTLADFLVLARNFGRKDAEPNQGDTDEDGDVDFSDFLMLAEKYRQS